MTKLVLQSIDWGISLGAPLQQRIAVKISS